MRPAHDALSKPGHIRPSRLSEAAAGSQAGRRHPGRMGSALLGAKFGFDGIPPALVKGLRESAPLDIRIDRSMVCMR